MHIFPFIILPNLIILGIILAILGQVRRHKKILLSGIIIAFGALLIMSSYFTFFMVSTHRQVGAIAAQLPDYPGSSHTTTWHPADIQGLIQAPTVTFTSEEELVPEAVAIYYKRWFEDRGWVQQARPPGYYFIFTTENQGATVQILDAQTWSITIWPIITFTW